MGGMEAVSSILNRLSLSCLRDILVEMLGVPEGSLGWRERFWVTEDMVRRLRWGRQERRRGPGTGWHQHSRDEPRLLTGRLMGSRQRVEGNPENSETRMME